MTTQDCSERHSFETDEVARWFVDFISAKGLPGLVPFLCKRCGRHHVAMGAEQARKERAELTEMPGCTSDQELHLQIARVLGCSLDELQVRCDLSKIKLIGGLSLEFVKIRPKKKSR